MEEITKAEIRNRYWTLRKNLTKNVLETYNLSINNLLKKKIPGNVHVFLPIEENFEVNIWPFIDSINHKNQLIGTSIYNGENNVKHVRLSQKTTFQKGHFNIPIPKDYQKANITQFEFILIPLMAYDSNGNRIGYWKGIYDRILKSCSNNCLKIGVSYFKPEISVPKQDHDICLDTCITPFGEYIFKQ